MTAFFEPRLVATPRSRAAPCASSGSAVPSSSGDDAKGASRHHQLVVVMLRLGGNAISVPKRSWVALSSGERAQRALYHNWAGGKYRWPRGDDFCLAGMCVPVVTMRLAISSS